MDPSMSRAIKPLAALLCFCAAVASAQSPAFEVASVRPCELSKREGYPRPGISVAGNRVTAAQTFTKLVEFAYDVKQYQVMGTPDALAHDAYCIAAKADGDRPAILDEVRPMLQNLLSERFQLKLRHETRELPVYALVVSANNVKLKESAPGTRYSARVTRAKDPKQLRLNATGDTMPQFAQRISSYTDRPVVDKTGLTGHYDFKLDWFLNSKSSAVDPGGPTVFTAIQQQLGLKLEPRKAPLDILIIDHAEKPSEH
jgi:uncharacterized protein (TIGR03435 family)